ncbi:MAG: hypothetical protein LC792_05665 [Actinobacteria bacterium]|nr:hypothetical protein [Actinomycetota bacterium]
MQLTDWLRAQWDRVAAVVLAVAGLGVLVAGWFGVSDQVLPAAQIPYLLSGGVVGAVLIAIGATAWISADLRDEWRKLDRLEEFAAALLDDGDRTDDNES